MNKLTIIHSGGKYGGEGHAIGGYINNIMFGMEECGIENITIPHDKSPEGFVTRLSAITKKLKSESKSLILHIQLTHPYDENHFTPEFIRNYSYPVVITAQELSSRETVEQQMEIVALLREADHSIFLNEKERMVAKSIEKNTFDTDNVITKSSVISVVTPGIPLVSKISEKTSDIVRFGMFRYHSGYVAETEFIKRFLNDPSTDDITFHIVGKLSEIEVLEYMAKNLLDLEIGNLKDPKRLEELLNASCNSKLRFHINKSKEEVSKLLASADIGVSLYPEGATGHSSSLPCYMAHNMVTIATASSKTPTALAKLRDEESGYTMNGGIIAIKVPKTICAKELLKFDVQKEIGKKAYDAFKEMQFFPVIKETVRSKGVEYFRKEASIQALTYKHIDAYSAVFKKQAFEANRAYSQKTLLSQGLNLGYIKR